MRMPVLFISHGSPMHAIEAGAVGRAWQAAAAAIVQQQGQPRAILMVSAHWDTNIPMLTGGEAPATIHDFGGFPEVLYRIQYRAAGAPGLAERIQASLREAGICTGIDAQRGLDHGAWAPLLHMWPQADVQVLQLSVQSALGARHHLAVGRALQSLRDEGVLIIGSGHMTHNLRDFFTSRGLPAVADYALQFRNWVDAAVRRQDVAALVDWDVQAPFALRAHPTPEHFLPLFVALGAAGERYGTSALHAGIEGNVLAMDAYRFD